MTSDLFTNESVVQRSGLLWETVRSSVSLPGLYPPVAKGDKLLFDGGLLNNLPVDVMRQIIGANHQIIASRLMRNGIEKIRYNFPSEMTLKIALLARLNISRNRYVMPPFFGAFIEAMLMGAKSREKENSLIADILISPDLSKFKSLSFESIEVDAMIKLGYCEAMVELNKVKSG